MHLQHLLDEDLANRDLSDRVEPDVASHFDRATHLLDEFAPGVGSDFAQIACNNSDLTSGVCDLLLDSSLKIVEFSDDTFTSGDFVCGGALPDWVWSEDEAQTDRKALRQLAKSPGRQHTLRLRQSDDMAKGSLFLASHAALDAPKSRGMVALRSLPMRYDEASASAFTEAFGLSAAESDIVRQIVNGGTLRALAAERGTAVGTVRNQLKNLLQKLSLSSQIDLVCLYAGFRQSHLSETAGRARYR